MRRDVLGWAAWLAVAAATAGCGSTAIRLLSVRADQARGWALDDDRVFADVAARRKVPASLDEVTRGVDRAFDELTALNGGDADDFRAVAVEVRRKPGDDGRPSGPTAKSAWAFRTTRDGRRSAARAVVNWGRAATVRLVEVEGGGCEVAACVEAMTPMEERALSAELLGRVAERLKPSAAL